MEIQKSSFYSPLDYVAAMNEAGDKIAAGEITRIVWRGMEFDKVQHGHLEKGKDIFGTFYRCSVCGEAFDDIGYGFDYCPVCGAKMDEVVEDETD